MTDERRSNPELSAASERLLTALGNVASDLHAAEALTGLGDRARHLVAELARSTRRRAASEPDPGHRDRDHKDTAADRERAAAPQLMHQLQQLRVCVSEVADVLEATTERLGTIELQLGDPDASVEQRLRESLERCEQVLMGIEHRIFAAAPVADVRVENDNDGGETETVTTPSRRAAADARRPTVLVVAASSSLRAKLCIDLEKQGLRTLAATDMVRALATASRLAPELVLLVPEGSRDVCSRMLEEWKEHSEHLEYDEHHEHHRHDQQDEQGGQAHPPRAAVMLVAGSALAADEVCAYGLLALRADYGAAAIAARLLRLDRDENEGPSKTS